MPAATATEPKPKAEPKPKEGAAPNPVVEVPAETLIALQAQVAALQAEVAKAPAEEPAAEPKPLADPVTFLCQRPGYIQVIESESWDVGPDAKIRKVFPGVRAEFGRDCLLTSDDPRVVEGLRKSKHFNSRFWEEGAPPHAPRPTVPEQMAAITQAVADRDPKALKAVVDTEKNVEDRDGKPYGGHRRDEVLVSAKQAAKHFKDE